MTSTTRQAWHAEPTLTSKRVRGGSLNTAVMVFAAYYLGGKLGLALTFPPNPISVLWPPNSILFAALLLCPATSWWLVLASAFSAHMVAELQGGVPLSMVLAWFVSNASEALIGALCVRALVRRELAFNKIEDVLAFIVAAVVAAFLSSFLDSAFVTLIGWGQASYWTVWRTRFAANALASAIIVPLIVTWARTSGAV